MKEGRNGVEGKRKGKRKGRNGRGEGKGCEGRKEGRKEGTTFERCKAAGTFRACAPKSECSKKCQFKMFN